MVANYGGFYGRRFFHRKIGRSERPDFWAPSPRVQRVAPHVLVAPPSSGAPHVLARPHPRRAARVRKASPLQKPHVSVKPHSSIKSVLLRRLQSEALCYGASSRKARART